MQRVLFYDDAPIYGGHQVTAIAAARFLARQGVEVVSAFSAANARLHEAWKGAGVRLELLELRLTRWQPFVSPFGIAAAPVRELLQRVAPDVVVAVQGTIVQANRVIEQSRRLQVPVVGFIPTALLFPPDQRLQAFVAHALARYHYRRPDAFITTSARACRELASDGVRTPIHLAYYGLDPARIRREPRDAARLRLGIPRDRFLLALLARLSIGTKGHDLLLRAAAALRSEMPELSLLFVGDGPDAARIDALTRELGIAGIVLRQPWLDDTTDVYAAADVIAIPSRHEGFPLVAIEAMFHERRVVAADVGALGEVLPASWLFPAGDTAALAAAIRRARTDDAGEAIALNRERALREFTEENFGRAFLDALRRVWSERRR
jgi:glycosyltransferase involved in cell wall biosynthesis